MQSCTTLLNWAIIVAMQLATLNLDTYKVVKLLQEKGYTKDQAEGFIDAVQDITLSGVATKQDLQDLRNEVKDEFRNMMRFQIIQTVTIIGVMVALLSFFG